jgi:hypothetical protein
MTKTPQDDQYGPEETARRRDEVIRVMANTPPQPRVTRPKRKKKAASGRVARKRASGAGKA